ncbi:MAG: NAD(P)H-hydrate epimerase [Candidatus Woesearchaeota archaeon]
MRSLTAAQMKEVDAVCMQELGIENEKLMEEAGKRVYELAAEILGNVSGKSVVVLVGPGNNGGDGLVAARHLAAEASVFVALSKEVKGLPKLQLERLEPFGISYIDYKESFPVMCACDLIIDALLGYSAFGAPRGIVRELIVSANRSGKKIISVDIPSGLDCTSGSIEGECIKAYATVTLGAMKAGLEKARGVSGKVYVADIGIPEGAYKRLGLEAPGFSGKKLAMP